MCYHPIEIKNKSRFFDLSGGQPFKMSVPCGHCPACEYQKSQELGVRAVYEWKNSDWAYFDTLTYNEKCHPYFHGIKCFSRDDITKFLKRLRITLHREGFDVKDKLKYVITSEYGTKRTKRAHYHIMWFSKVPGLTPYDIWRVTRKTWRKGWNDHPDEYQDHIVNRANGCFYVCKYICKDNKFYSAYEELLERYKDDKVKLMEVIKDSKPFLPFHRESIGFGSCIADFYSDRFDELIHEGVEYWLNGTVEHSPIPHYIRRKYFYDKVKDSRYAAGYYLKLNSLGVEYRMSILDDTIHNQAVQMYNVLQNSDLCNPDIKCSVDEIYSKLNNRTFEDLAMYNICYRGRLIPIDFMYRKTIPDPYDFYRYSLTIHDGRPLVDTDSCPYSSLYKQHASKVFNQDSSPFFYHFDDINFLYELVAFHQIKAKELYSKQRSEEYENIKVIYETLGLIH